MKRFLAGFAATVVSMFALNGLANAQQAEVLSAAEIVQVFIGKTIKQVDDQYWAFFEPGGALGGLYVNNEDSGRWGFYQNQLCQRWNTWADGKPMCFFVLRGVQGAYRFDNGQGDGFNVTVQPGNPQQLL